VDKAREMFYGIGLMKSPTLSKESIERIRGWLKHSGAIGIAITAQSFKNFIKKEYFSKEDFDIIAIDEAADIIIARDFIDGFRMLKYIRDLEK